MKQFGLAFAAWFEKYTFILIPGALVAGWFLSEQLSPYAYTIPYLFGYITLVMALGCGIGHLKAVMRQPFPIVLTLLLAHAAAPLVAYAIGASIFGSQSDYTTGLMLFSVIPLGISAVLWVGTSGGNVPFILSVVVLDTMLSPIVVPFLMELLAGSTGLQWDTGQLVTDLFRMVVLPTALGVLIYELSKGKAKAWSAPVAQPLSKLFFVCVVMINAAVIAPQAQSIRQDLLSVIPAVLLLIVLCYMLGYFGSYLAPGRTRELGISLTYASGMRNISLGMVLATAYFPPAVSVPVVLSILFQQPVATVVHAVIQRIKTSSVKEGNHETFS
ncbi:sodium bile acid symporter family protein [Paenibacillus algicola]|uniref:Sodium bile acid symporter family protein n=1 Tax=Paenibacillus algicola TaxID=2565926 RepID=A0A4P8XSF5_9BACL|nr:bile acid:sodium symporter [Paenibacillus algicola]QCT03559.1 sodium bile acid symporter family protein [Paenibacillus algicola]